MPNIEAEQLEPSVKVDILPSEGAADVYNFLLKDKKPEIIDLLASKYKSNANDFVAYLPNGGTIFELGSGLGMALNHFHNLGFNVSGVDISSETIKLAKNKFPHIKIENQDIKNVKFSKPIDGIYERLALMNLPKADILEVFNNAYRGLKPSGVFQCSLEIREPKYTGWSFSPTTEKFLYKGQEARLGQYLYLSFFLENELLSALETAGFKILKAIITEEPETSQYKIITALCQK